MHRTQEIRIRITPEFRDALMRMTNRCGLTPRSFLAELVEVAIIDAYEARFKEPLGRAPIGIDLIESQEGPQRATACQSDPN